MMVENEKEEQEEEVRQSETNVRRLSLEKLQVESEKLRVFLGGLPFDGSGDDI